MCVLVYLGVDIKIRTEYTLIVAFACVGIWKKEKTKPDFSSARCISKNWNLNHNDGMADNLNILINPFSNTQYVTEQNGVRIRDIP